MSRCLLTFFLVRCVLSATRRNLSWMTANTARYERADRSKTGYGVCRWRKQAASERSEFAAPSLANAVRLSPFWAATSFFLSSFSFWSHRKKKWIANVNGSLQEKMGKRDMFPWNIGILFRLFTVYFQLKISRIFLWLKIWLFFGYNDRKRYNYHWNYNRRVRWKKPIH